MGSNFYSHTPPLFKKLGILDIFKQREYQIGIFVHDALNGMLPPHFKDYFPHIKHIHSTRCKFKGDLYVPKYNNNIGQSSIKFVGPKIWNNIPETIIFKIDLKMVLKTHSQMQLLLVVNQKDLNTYLN